MTAGTLAPAPGGIRRDIEVLRAVAILLVLLFHAGLAAVPGGFVGVDVFFVISGFLITALLLREAEKSGRISLREFWARRVRRLLPAAATVLAFSAAVAWFALPASLRPTYGWDIASAAGYVANWRLGARSVDYLGADLPPSPVLHFWSLSVEEQFYLAWPLLLVAVVWGVRRFGWPLRRTAAVALTGVAAPSLWWSATSTAANPEFAFFDTRARMWELALGGLVAVAAPALARLGGRAAAALAAVGAVAIVASTLGVTPATHWPGTLALVPTVGTAMVIAAGSSGADPLRAGARAWGPLVWVGGLSYSLYLWHWPMLVGAEAWARGLSPAAGLGVVAAAFVPAWLTHRFIENPVRFSARLKRAPGRSLALGAGLSLAAVGIGAGVAAGYTAPAPGPAGLAAWGQRPPVVELSAEAAAQPLGGAWLWPEPRARWSSVPDSTLAELSPRPEDAATDGPGGRDRACTSIVQVPDREPQSCLRGDPDASRRILIVGDSKANQWQNVIHAYGEARGWQVEVATKASCPFVDGTVFYSTDKPYAQCQEWNARMMARIEADPPDVVITSTLTKTAGPPGATLSAQSTGAESRAGHARRWAQLQQLGVTVIAIADNPLARGKIATCVANHPDDLHACDLGRAQAVADSGGPMLMRAAAEADGVVALDMTDYFCDDELCPAVIGNVPVYRTGYHATDTFLMTLAPYVAWELDQVLPE